MERPEKAETSQKIVLIRSDNHPSIQRSTFDKYHATPAQHLNLDGQSNWVETGFVSTFAYNPQKSALNVYPPEPLFMQSMASGESGRGDYIHFIILDKDAYGTKMIDLNGGTSGFEQISQEDVRANAKDFMPTESKPLKMDGTVWKLPTFDREYPQVFNTETVSVQLAHGAWRSDYEILLGGNWQKYALTKTITREEFQKYFKNNLPPVDAFATQLITGKIDEVLGKNSATPATSPLGETVEQVAKHTETAKAHFAPILEAERQAREIEAQQKELQKQKKERQAQEKELERQEANQWWENLSLKDKKSSIDFIMQYLPDTKKPYLETSSGYYIKLCLSIAKNKKAEIEQRNQIDNKKREIVDEITQIKSKILSTPDSDSKLSENYAKKLDHLILSLNSINYEFELNRFEKRAEELKGEFLLFSKTIMHIQQIQQTMLEEAFPGGLSDKKSTKFTAENQHYLYLNRLIGEIIEGEKYDKNTLNKAEQKARQVLTDFQNSLPQEAQERMPRKESAKKLKKPETCNTLIRNLKQNLIDKGYDNRSEPYQQLKRLTDPLINQPVEDVRQQLQRSQEYVNSLPNLRSQFSLGTHN